MNKILCATVALQLLFHCTWSLAGDWQMAKAPIMTRWAKLVSPDNALPEYPRPQMVREKWMNLNGLWDFTPTSSDASTTKILVPYPMESALSGVMKHYDRSTYRRTFKMPADWNGQRIFLHFGAVDWEATVYVNDKKLGTHRGGYDSFSYEITDALKSDGDQEIKVEVFDPTDESQARGKQTTKPGGIFYTPVSGIWQTVWIEPVPNLSIKSLKIVPDVDGGKVTVSPELNSGAIGGQMDYTYTVTDGGKTIAESKDGVLKIPDAILWTPDNPHLYTLKISLTNGNATDKITSYFAMRKIGVGFDGSHQRLMLNGKAVFEIGPLDQGFWPDGIYTAPTDDALKYDLEMTKKLGFNMIRKHVKVEPERWYYWADKLGLLIWQDMPSAFKPKDEQTKKQFENELQAMIEQHRNHPCIINWVVFNEGWGQYDTERLTKWVKDFDPTRLANDASGWTDKGVGDTMDMHKYPGPGSPQPETIRAHVLGEFGGLGLGVDGHTWTNKTWGYQGMEDREHLTQQYVRLLQRVWGLRDEMGLSAAVYTQTTDVETECNGLMTYDREILKVDPERIRAANTGNVPVLVRSTVVPTAMDQSIAWRYTMQNPADGWFKSDFDDSSWKTGPAGFGTEGTPGAVVRTNWNTGDIWIRREFDLPADAKIADLQLLLHHDEDAEVYINGVQATKARHYTVNYVEQAISADAKKTLHPGKNVFAVHCHQTDGGQYIDVGLVRVVEKMPVATR